MPLAFASWTTCLKGMVLLDVDTSLRYNDNVGRCVACMISQQDASFSFVLSFLRVHLLLLQSC